jgi:hypothetical protein
MILWGSANSPVAKFDKTGAYIKSWGSKGTGPGQLHELDCRSANELYAGELTNWRVQKLTLHP